MKKYLVCPKCGSTLKKRSSGVYLTPKLQKLFDILIKTYDPSSHRRLPLDTSKITSLLYDGKYRSCTTVYSNLTRLRKALKDTPFRIQTVYKNNVPHWWILKRKVVDHPPTQ